MKLFLRLAWRSFWRHRRRTILVVLAIGLTMTLMMWYDGLVAGFEGDIYANAIKILGGNIQIHASGYNSQADQTPILPLADDKTVLAAALAQPQVVAASRRIQTNGLASNREGAFPVNIIGVEPKEELPVSLVAQNISAGRFLESADQDQALIGKGLADAMGVGVGDRFTLTGRATHDQMRNRSMTVVGIYDVGLPDVERRTVYLSLAEAQDLYNLTGQSTEIMLSLQELGQEPAVISKLASLPGIEIVSWQTSFPEMQAALAAKGGVMNVFSVVILVIAGIGILNLLMMAVFERTREIGVLGALGLKSHQISLLFLLEGAFMGLAGVVFGVVLGLLVMFILGKVGMDFSAYSNMTSYTALISGRVYPTLGVEKLPMRILTTLIVSVLAAYYPARTAARQEPAAALHFV